MKAAEFPMRINKYLALKGYATRRGADELVAAGRVSVNGKRAVLGTKVAESDKVEVRGKLRAKPYRYFAYYKPRGVITHSPQRGEHEIATVSGIPGVFPVGRLDKDSDGLIILTDDGRIVDRLLSPKYDHDKEYAVSVVHNVNPSFKNKMEKGVDIEGDRTKPCHVTLIGERSFRITLTEGKKHQIRRMCAALGNDVVNLKRVRILNVRLGEMRSGTHRRIEGPELTKFLKDLGL
ncbi:MAG: rRNA pseudouridine synthase [Candidatus Niyogibacteria bacterium]|nr:rRNA pseudouridine synthase [Candidatus Niyogibacteria bacterium]